MTHSTAMSFELIIVVLLCSNYPNNALWFICANKDDGNSFAVVVNFSNIEIRRCTLNKEFERCCRFLAEMMEKYGVLVLQDIAVEIQFEPDTCYDEVEGRKVRYATYIKGYKNIAGITI